MSDLLERVMADVRDMRRATAQEVERRLAEAMIAGMDLVVWERTDFDLKVGADSTLTTRVAFRLLPPRRYALGEKVPGLTPPPEGFEGGPYTVTCRLFHSGGRELLLA